MAANPNRTVSPPCKPPLNPAIAAMMILAAKTSRRYVLTASVTSTRPTAFKMPVDSQLSNFTGKLELLLLNSLSFLKCHICQATNFFRAKFDGSAQGHFRSLMAPDEHIRDTQTIELTTPGMRVLLRRLFKFRNCPLPLAMLGGNVTQRFVG